jgi:hypothetical protein
MFMSMYLLASLGQRFPTLRKTAERGDVVYILRIAESEAAATSLNP